MSQIIDTTWSDDGLELTIVRQVPEGKLTTTYVWDTPPSEDIIRRAIREKPSLEMLNPNEDSGHYVRKFKPTKNLILYFHHNWGPPRWNLPKFRFKFRRWRLELGAGWIYHCYDLILTTPSDVEEATAKLPPPK